MDVPEYCLAKPEACETFPFGPEVTVYRVKHKMFALYSDGEGGVPTVNLKCEPNQALALRDIWSAVTPGYHMNKKHWNTVILDGSIPDSEIERMIDQSYTLVVHGLTQADREALESRYPADQLYR